MAKALFAALLLAAAGCSTLQPLPDARPATVRGAIEPGDYVEIVRTDGSQLKLKVEELGADHLRGTSGGRPQTVALAEVRTISTRVMTTSDKAWTAVGVAVAVGAVIAIASDGGDGGGGGGGGY